MIKICERYSDNYLGNKCQAVAFKVVSDIETQFFVNGQNFACVRDIVYLRYR
jgi:hypothetical protein